LQNNKVKIENLSQMWRGLLDKSGLVNLDLREKLFLTGGGFFIVLFLGFQFVLLPYLSSKSNLEESIVRKEQELVKIRQLRADYLKLKNQEGDVLSKIVTREPGFALFTFPVAVSLNLFLTPFFVFSFGISSSSSFVMF